MLRRNSISDGADPAQAIEAGWLDEARAAHREEFYELSLLMRALDRFFDPDSFPYEHKDLISRSFRHELLAVRNIILRIQGIIEMLVPVSKRNAFWFKKYAESELLTGRKREALRQKLYLQDTPEKSLFLLYDSIMSVKGVLSDVVRSESVSFGTFQSIGEIVSRAVRDNRHFNPFDAELDPELDRITNFTIAKTVRAIEDREERKAVSVVFVQLFRLLRYLDHVDLVTPKHAALHSSLLIVILLRSEIEELKAYSQSMSERLGGGASDTLHAVSVQLSMESRRVFNHELKGIFERTSAKQIRGKLENSHGILKNLFEQVIIQLASNWAPGIKGEDIFDSFVTKFQQSLKLREDVVVLHKLLSDFISAPDDTARLKMFEALTGFMTYFESFTFRFLRSDDYDDYESFFESIKAYARGGGSGLSPARFLDKCGQFKIFLETSLRLIGNRTELCDRPIDKDRVRALIAQYV